MPEYLPIIRPARLSATMRPAAAANRILFTAAEMADFIKVGGLGDVAAALPRVLRRHADVRVLLPGLPAVRKAASNAASGLQIVRRMPGMAGLPPWSLGRFATPDGLGIYVVLCDELYDRPGTPYGPSAGSDFPDNARRFAQLSRAVAELAAGEADPDWTPDVVHLNDWHTALASGYLRWKGVATPSILTIHNLAYQGLFDRACLAELGIPAAAFAIDGVEFHGRLSFLKGGIFYASQVTTVSQTYAREITTPAYGCGLDGLLAERWRQGRLTGIVNGIDDSWAHLVDGAQISDHVVQQWKRQNAAAVRAMFELPQSHGPLFSVISRLVQQKGVDLSLAAAERIVALGGQVVIMGHGEPALERQVAGLAQRYPHAVAAHIGFDEAAGRRLFAASDFLLMPSRFEPCGLSQMYAQRSGALPIASRTGGLVDTIEDGVSGFLFRPLTRAGLLGAVMRALATFYSRSTYRHMRDHAMARDFDWRVPAHRYVDLYARALAGQGA